jgi:hypothetical protein
MYVYIYVHTYIYIYMYIPAFSREVPEDKVDEAYIKNVLISIYMRMDVYFTPSYPLPPNPLLEYISFSAFSVIFYVRIYVRYL